jgi:hypothetical protein
LLFLFPYLNDLHIHKSESHTIYAYTQERQGTYLSDVLDAKNDRLLPVVMAESSCPGSHAKCPQGKALNENRINTSGLKEMATQNRCTLNICWLNEWPQGVELGN